MKYLQAKEIADRLMQELAPHCERIEIAGSIRREKKEVKDIEIVCVPIMITVQKTDLFGEQKETATWHPDFKKAVTTLGQIIKGSGINRYVQIHVDGIINLDLFICTPETWAVNFAIRTGSATFSHQVLATRWRMLGYHCFEGVLSKALIPIYPNDEKDLFRILNLSYVSPKDRFGAGETIEWDGCFYRVIRYVFLSKRIDILLLPEPHWDAKNPENFSLQLPFCLLDNQYAR